MRRLSVVDAYMRECLALEADTSLGSDRVTRVLERMITERGRPMQNGHVESFHCRLRDEYLNASWFRTLNDVRCTLAAWREEVQLRAAA
jgi:putative transposase